MRGQVCNLSMKKCHSLSSIILGYLCGGTGRVEERYMEMETELVRTQDCVEHHLAAEVVAE